MALTKGREEEQERHVELVNELREVLEQKRVLKSVEMFTPETNRYPTISRYIEEV